MDWAARLLPINFFHRSVIGDPGFYPAVETHGDKFIFFICITRGQRLEPAKHFPVTNCPRHKWRNRDYSYENASEDQSPPASACRRNAFHSVATEEIKLMRKQNGHENVQLNRDQQNSAIRPQQNCCRRCHTAVRPIAERCALQSCYRKVKREGGEEYFQSFGQSRGRIVCQKRTQTGQHESKLRDFRPEQSQCNVRAQEASPEIREHLYEQHGPVMLHAKDGKNECEKCRIARQTNVCRRDFVRTAEAVNSVLQPILGYVAVNERVSNDPRKPENEDQT